MRIIDVKIGEAYAERSTSWSSARRVVVKEQRRRANVTIVSPDERTLREVWYDNHPEWRDEGLRYFVNHRGEQCTVHVGRRLRVLLVRLDDGREIWLEGARRLVCPWAEHLRTEKEAKAQATARRESAAEFRRIAEEISAALGVEVLAITGEYRGAGRYLRISESAALALHEKFGCHAASES